jgi:predicted O-methyltransferase YrrM
MDFIHTEIENYCEAHTSPESQLLAQLNRNTHLKVLQPRMLSGHYQGRLLSMLSNMIRPSSILEIGTYTGYSAICLAEGLTENGQLVTIDINHELEDFAQQHIEASANAKQIKQIIGNALQIIPTLKQTFDLVFIDADKPNYPHYLNLTLPLLNQGAYLIADNVLWDGKVLAHKREKIQDESTRAIIEFNQMVQNDTTLENILLPIRDGLMIVRKK